MDVMPRLQSLSGSFGPPPPAPSKGKGPPLPQGAYPPRGPGGALAPRMAAEEATVRQTIDTFYQCLVASATVTYLIRIR